MDRAESERRQCCGTNNSREVNAEDQQVESKELSKRRRISELSGDLCASFLQFNWSLERLQSDKYQQTALL